MARAIYSHELNDPDFSWLISSYREAHPEFCLVDASGLPIALFIGGKVTQAEQSFSEDLEESNDDEADKIPDLSEDKKY